MLVCSNVQQTSENQEPQRPLCQSPPNQPQHRSRAGPEITRKLQQVSGSPDKLVLMRHEVQGQASKSINRSDPVNASQLQKDKGGPRSTSEVSPLVRACQAGTQLWLSWSTLVSQSLYINSNSVNAQH